MRSRLTYGAFALGWALVRRLPERLAYLLFDLAGIAAACRGGGGVRQLRRNLARVLGPDAPAERLDALTREAMRSYLRYWCDTFRSPDWTPERTVGRVRVEGGEHLYGALAEGRGVVAALPHMGNWDHAGAWAALTGIPVTTVAERLRPERLFERFVAHRAALGITVLPLTGGEDVYGALSARLPTGAFVPLLADRDLVGSGVAVQLFGEPARLAPGPALLALRTGAALLPVTCWYDGPGLVLQIHPAVVVAPAGGMRGRVTAMMQAVADVFAAAIAAHPADWHMLQPVWSADLPIPAPRTTVAAR